MSKSVTIAALSHDLVGKRSFVTLVWDDDATKRVSLPVPFGCDLAGIQAESEKAMRELAEETAAVTVNLAK